MQAGVSSARLAPQMGRFPARIPKSIVAGLGFRYESGDRSWMTNGIINGMESKPVR